MVYLDHAATTPMFPAAVEAMTAVLSTVGNASSLHGSGRAGAAALEEARESIAADLGARPSEVIFTSGGTESDNLAVKGIYWARRDADPRHRAFWSARSSITRYSMRWTGSSSTRAPGEWLPTTPMGRSRRAALREPWTATTRSP